jgi:3-dehydroquinate synthase
MTYIYDLTIARQHQSRYLIGPNLIDHLKDQLSLLTYDRAYVIHDQDLPAHVLEKCLPPLELYPEYCLPIPAQERHKTWDTVQNILEKLYQVPLSRHCLVIAIGGGVIGDVVGFAASLYKRGVSWAFIPTSLIAQVDSSIGGKTAVNIKFGKNLLGTFHFPRLVIADINLLKTLPQCHLQAGMAEVIKIAAMTDHTLLNQLHQEHLSFANFNTIIPIIKRAAQLKITVVENDPFETHTIGRNRLNFGHTIGHALEGFYQGKILHGEAIATGMIAELEIAQKMAIWPQQCPWLDSFKRLIDKFVPTRKNYPLPSWNQLLSYLHQDKKISGNNLHFVIPHLTRGAQQIIFNDQEQTLPNCLETANMSTTIMGF